MRLYKSLEHLHLKCNVHFFFLHLKSLVETEKGMEKMIKKSNCCRLIYMLKKCINILYFEKRMNDESSGDSKKIMVNKKKVNIQCLFIVSHND